MSDAAFKTAAYPSYTTHELHKMIDSVEERYSRAATMEATIADLAQIVKIQGEIDRRAKVAAGDVSVMTDGERLRRVKAGA